MPETATRTSAEIRSEVVAAADRLRELRDLPADKRGDTWRQEVTDAVSTVHELDAEFEARSRIERFDLEQAVWDAALAAPPDRRGSRGPTAAFDPIESDEVRTPGEQFTATDVYKDHRGRYDAGYVEHAIRGSIAGREVRALLAGGTVSVTIGDDGGVWRPLGTPIPPLERRQRLFIRDVLNVIPTGLGAIPYIRELNAATNETGATAVAEGSEKPEVTLEFEQHIAPVVKIAAWVPVTSEIIEDAPTLEGYINTRLAYMVALREEAQVLKGPGTGANMRGIMETTGTQTQVAVAGDVPSTIAASIGKIENVDGEATFAAMNPLDFWGAVATRHATQFDNGFGGNAPAVLSSITWGLTAIRTRSLAQTEALVGAAMGATIADRMETVIRVGNQHGTYFVENKVAVLAEERVALLVHRPDFFVETTIDLTA